jgi:hypothetical protein
MRVWYVWREIGRQGPTVNNVGPVCSSDCTLGEGQKRVQTPVPAVALTSVQYYARQLRQMIKFLLVLGLANVQTTGVPIPTLVSRVFLLEILPL